jgi:transcriptional regulator with XRE-family HTH domain
MRHPQPPTFGDVLRHWRGRRRISQLALSCDAGISQRHLSCVESGRARPSRDMALLLAETLDLPLRARNDLLLAAGFAPLFPERPPEDRAMAEALGMVDRILAAQGLNPAIAVDRHWTLRAANAAAGWLMQGLPPALLAPPVNVLRISLHPEGLAPRIRNLADWRAHVLHRIDRQIDASGDAGLAALREELAALPGPRARHVLADPDRLFVPVQIETDLGLLSFVTMTTVFGAPLDVGLSELAIETFLPVDAATTAALAVIGQSQLPISTKADQ